MEPRSVPSPTMQQKVVLAPTGTILSCGNIWKLGLLGISYPEKQGERRLKSLKIRERKHSVFDNLWSLSIWPWCICVLLHSLALCPSLARTLIDSDVHSRGSAEVQVHWCRPLISGTEIVFCRAQTEFNSKQEIEVSIDVPFWKDANQYQHILNAETASMSVYRYKKLAHKSKCRHFVNQDVTCLDRTRDSEKSGGGEPTIKAVLLHRRQFRWVRSWESACQRWWRFLQPRIWITVARPCLLRSSTASVREGLRRGQTEKECSEFNDSDHSERTWTCLECSGMI